MISRAPGRYVLAYGSGILAMFALASLFASIFASSAINEDRAHTITCVQDAERSGCYETARGWYYAYRCSYTDADGFYRTYAPLRRVVMYDDKSDCMNDNYAKDITLHVPDYTESLPELSFVYILTPLVFFCADVVFLVLWLLDTLKRASKNELAEVIAPEETRVPLITDYEMLYFDSLMPSAVLGNTM